MQAKFKWICFWTILTTIGLSGSEISKCQQGQNCKLPDCFCATFNHPLINTTKNIPQMVYFGFDDALTPVVDPYYKKLFRSNRINPNGCSIGMTLFVSHQYTSYADVKYFHDNGMEVASHSVKHGHTITEGSLYREAKQQKLNLAGLSGIPLSDIIGWRSPFLETAGDHQPDVLQSLGYQYDASLTYSRGTMRESNPWPFTADYGWPYRCIMKPCLSKPHPGFWEFPVNSMIDFKDQYPCNYVDGCMNRPGNEYEAFKYLMDNFNNAYEGNRAPLGMHMHASWFVTKYNFKAMDRFIKEILKRPDVYIVTIKQVLDWMKYPTKLSEIEHFTPWQCKTSILKPMHKIQKTPELTTKTSTKPTVTTRRTTTTTTETTTMTTTKRPVTTHKPWYPNQFISSTTTTKRPVTTHIPWYHNIFISSSTTTTKQPVTTQLPWYANTYNPPKTTIKPVTSSASTNNINWSWIWNGIFNKPKPIPHHSTKTGVQARCVQELNCKLPDCFCEGNKNPGGFTKDATPQFVYVSFDGDINSRVFSKYRKIFSGERKNPDNCPISSTFFVSDSGSRSGYVSFLKNKGQEIAMRGSSSRRITNIGEFNRIVSTKRFEMSRIGIPVSGWRSPELKPMGDEQFSALTKQGLLYDSTLVYLDTNTDKQWPFTLDYGWNDHCVITECPKMRYPGLWEIPNVPVTDYKDMYQCNYADGCMYAPETTEDTFNFLWNNFKNFYETNKAPFGINLRHLWFTHDAYRNNAKGFEMFLDKLGQMKDVYIVSNEKLISWMKNPIPLSEMKYHC